MCKQTDVAAVRNDTYLQWSMSMLGQPLSQSELRMLPSRPLGADQKVAVLLNANARKVTAKVVRALSHVVPEEDLFVSRSEMDARRIAQAVVDRRYGTVFS